MKFDGSLESVHIEGFRSLADVTFRPRPGVTVLLGPNGGGKSNLIRFFEMMEAMLYRHSLAHFIGMNCGADDQLFEGGKRTPELSATIGLSREQKFYQYAFRLRLTPDDHFVVAEESLRGGESEDGATLLWQARGNGSGETRITEIIRPDNEGEDQEAAQCFRAFAHDLGAYHFNDTSDYSVFNKLWDVNDWMRFRPDGGNLAAVLHAVSKYAPERYEQICRHIGRVIPGFRQFDIEERFGRVMVRWTPDGSEKRLGPHLTSDGSLRFFALVTLLQLPREMLPRVIFLDEPELGLHPAGIDLVGGMIRSLSHHRQIVVATQSPRVVDGMGVEEIEVFEMKNRRTRLRAFGREEFRSWFEDGYSAGELWQKNLLGGHP